MVISMKRKIIHHLVENICCSLENHSYNGHRLWNTVQILSTDSYIYSSTETKKCVLHNDKIEKKETTQDKFVWTHTFYPESVECWLAKFKTKNLRIVVWGWILFMIGFGLYVNIPVCWSSRKASVQEITRCCSLFCCKAPLNGAVLHTTKWSSL